MDTPSVPTTYDFISDASKLRFDRGLPVEDSPYGRFLNSEHIRQRHAKIEFCMNKDRSLQDEGDSNSTVTALRPSSNITWGCHRPEDLIRAIRDFAELQYHSRVADKVAKEPQVRLESEDASGLMTYYRLFDQLFFFGSLQNLCYVELVKMPPPTKGLIMSNVTPRRDIPSTHACRISIALDASIISTKASRSKRYIRVLLHEMLHAFFAMYCCRCDEQCLERYHQEVGNGHGRAWQSCAYAIEKASEKFFPHVLDMGRAKGLVGDWIATGLLPFREEDLPPWELEYSKVDKLYKAYRVEEEKQNRKQEKARRKQEKERRKQEKKSKAGT